MTHVLWWFYQCFCLSSFSFCPEQVPSIYRPSTAREINQTKIVSRWHEQSCPKIQPTDGSYCIHYVDVSYCIHYDFAWARSTLVLNTCQCFTGPRQFRKNLKRRLFPDDTDNVYTNYTLSVPPYRSLSTGSGSIFGDRTGRASPEISIGRTAIVVACAPYGATSVHAALPVRLRSRESNPGHALSLLVTTPRRWPFPFGPTVLDGFRSTRSQKNT